jgi:hypothetical protein
LVRVAALLAIILAATVSERGRGQGADPAEDERVLRDAGVATDAAGLIAFFRSRVPTPADHDRLTARVGELGSPSFPERERASKELTRAGRLALPLLRPALSSADLEVARRAARCVEEIEQSPEASLLASAARLVGSSRKPGAVEVLVAVLPRVEDEAAEEAIFEALVAVGLQGGVADPVLLITAGDKDPLKRAAAGFVLGQADPTQRLTAVRLLGDADARVRYRSAAGLLRGGDRAAVPALIALLDDGPVSLAWRAEELLDRLAGEADLPGAAGADEASRHRARLARVEWWKANADRVDLTRVNREEAYLGLNLVVELDGANRGGKGRVWECGADGRPRWEIRDLNRPIDARLLPSGNVLIAEHGPPRVTERQRDGTVVWEFRPAGQPVSCQRLPNGNTFITTYNELLEVNRDKAVVGSIRLPNLMIFYGCKLRNGHYVYVASNNHVVEVDAAGNQIVSAAVENSGGWASVDLLANGNFLVALYNAKKVIEITRSGKVAWQCEVEAPGHATRLRNGNTLVASIEGRRVVEFDRSGKEVWRQATAGRPFHAYRR